MLTAISSATTQLRATGLTYNSIISNIVITFDQALEKGTGNITLRDGSASGTVLQTIAVTSGSVTISGAVVTIVPPSSLPTSTDVFVVVDAGAFTNVNIDNPSPLIDTYNFTTSIAPALGSSFGGGFVICNSGSFSWIVAPSSSQVARNWYSRDDANTTAQQVSGCTGWFVPSCGQLLNPGYTCRDFWDSFSCAFYWSSSELTPGSAWAVNVATGGIDVGPNTINFKSQTKSVRAFRTVTY